MPTISAAELAAIQADIEDTAMPDTCTLMGPAVNASNGQGGYKTTRGTAIATTNCRLDILLGKEQDASGAIQPYVRSVLTLPHDTVILNSYQVIHNGITYNVVGDVSTDTSWIASKRVLLEKAR